MGEQDAQKYAFIENYDGDLEFKGYFGFAVDILRKFAATFVAPMAWICTGIYVV